MCAPQDFSIATRLQGFFWGDFFFLEYFSSHRRGVLGDSTGSCNAMRCDAMRWTGSGPCNGVATGQWGQENSGLDVLTFLGMDARTWLGGGYHRTGERGCRYVHRLPSGREDGVDGGEGAEGTGDGESRDQRPRHQGSSTVGGARSRTGQIGRCKRTEKRLEVGRLGIENRKLQLKLSLTTRCVDSAGTATEFCWCTYDLPG